VESIKAFESLTTNLSGEGIQEKAAKARILLRLMEQWKDVTIHLMAR